MNKDRLLTGEEIKTRIDEYWELYRDLWNEGVINESDYESGIDYWTLEAQGTKTASIVAGEVADAYEGLLDGMGLGIDNFKKSDWDYVQEIRSRFGV